MQLQRAQNQMELAQAEVNARENELVRLELESDYGSNDEHKDITKPKRLAFQQIDEQTDCMKNILEVITKQQAQKRDTDGNGKVSQWLQDTGETTSKYSPFVPRKTPANVAQVGYMPQAQSRTHFQQTP